MSYTSKQGSKQQLPPLIDELSAIHHITNHHIPIPVPSVRVHHPSSPLPSVFSPRNFRITQLSPQSWQAWRILQKI